MGKTKKAVKDPWLWLKTLSGAVVGGAATAAAQSLMTGQSLSQAKGAAAAGAILTVAAMFSPQPHKAGSAK
jgi:hypothetical protein